MSRFLSFLLLVLGGCATSPQERPLTVQQVVERAEALDGREITVSGWIEECWPRGCVLYASRKEASKELPYFLSVGPSQWFDTFAARHTPGRVTLRARFNAHCITDPGTGAIAVCADRVSNLEPIRVLP